MSNEYRIIPPPEMARLMCEGETLEFEDGELARWLGYLGFLLYRQDLEMVPLTGKWWLAPCRVKEKPKPKPTTKAKPQLLSVLEDCEMWLAELQGTDYDSEGAVTAQLDEIRAAIAKARGEG